MDQFAELRITKQLLWKCENRQKLAHEKVIIRYQISSHPSIRNRKLLILQCKRVEDANVAGHVKRTKPVSSDIWHARLEYIQLGKLKSIEECVDGLISKQVANSTDEDDICEECAYGKSSVKDSTRSTYGTLKTQSLLEMIQSDVMGPMHTTSQGGARYMVPIIDEYSRNVMVHLMKQKSQIIDYFL